MPLNKSLGLVLTVTCAGAVWGCGDGRAPLSPASPSSLSRPSVGRADAGVTPAPRFIDRDGDGYDDGPEPEGMPAPGTEAPPNPEGVPLPDQAPVPVPVTVNIIGPSGAGAFVPNPLQAALGNMIVWANTDLITHVIVLDDGTPVGSLSPGQSSIPIALATETMGYHCTLHPTMVGQITILPAGGPVPPDPVQVPFPVPSEGAPAPTDPDDDGYDDDYYLKIVDRPSSIVHRRSSIVDVTFFRAA